MSVTPHITRTSLECQNFSGKMRKILVYVAIFIDAIASLFQAGKDGWKVTSSCCSTPIEKVMRAWSAMSAVPSVR